MAVNFISPLAARRNFAVVPVVDLLLPPQIGEVFGQFIPHRLVFVRVGKEDFDGAFGLVRHIPAGDSFCKLGQPAMSLLSVKSEGQQV